MEVIQWYFTFSSLSSWVGCRFRVGIFVANTRHTKEIADAQNSAVGIINAANKSWNSEKEALLAKEENQKYRSVESELKESRQELKSQENRLLQEKSF